MYVISSAVIIEVILKFFAESVSPMDIGKSAPRADLNSSNY